MRALFAILALLGVAGIAFGVLTIIWGASGSNAAPFSFENYGGPGPIIAGVVVLVESLYLLSIWKPPGLNSQIKERTMRPLSLIGIVLLALGAFIIFRGASYKSKDEVLRVGDLKASVEEKHAAPTWVGGAAIVAGVVLLAAGMRRRA